MSASDSCTLKRPNRKMPAVQGIHEYWLTERFDFAYDTFHQCDMGEPSCYGCGWCPMEERLNWTVWDRAHLIDRWAGGLDGPQNLVLLCGVCHASMPSFGQGDELPAIAWIKARENWMARTSRWIKEMLALGMTQDLVEAYVCQRPRGHGDG